MDNHATGFALPEVYEKGTPSRRCFFVLAMEVLNSFRLAESRGLFSSLHVPPVRHRLSLCVDDLVLFLTPSAQGIVLVRAVLEAFAGVSGLHTNISKVPCHFDKVLSRRH
jgi:hypothetical protein